MVGTRISLYPELAGFYGLFDISGDILLVSSGDRVLLRLAGPIAQVVCLSLVVHTHAEFTNIVFHHSQVGIGERKFGIEFEGTFEKRNRCVRPGCVEDLNARAESFQGLKRRRRGLFKRDIELLHRTQRLAEFVANFCSCFSQCFEHMVLVARLCLRARQRFPAYAVGRLEGEKVLRTNLRNRPVENGGAPGSLAKFLRDRWCEFCFGWLAHQAEGLLDLVIGDNAQEG